MEKKSLADKSDEELIKSKKTLSAILVTVMAIFVGYLSYFAFRLFYLKLDSEPVLVIGLIVLVGGMIPLAAMVSAISTELRKRGVEVQK
jgi:hypothetical protein